MIRYKVTIDEVLELLNDALDDDQAAISALVNARVPCSADLAVHPTIQVGQAEGNMMKGEPPVVGLLGVLGILNGLFGVNDRGRGPITAICEGGRVTRFQLTENW